MLKKEFKRKDVDRMRNLIRGNANASSETQVGWNKKIIYYKECYIWTEGRKTWTIKDGIKQTISKLDAIKKEVFMPLCCPKCSKVMKHHLDKSNYKMHKKCHSCVVEFEHKLKIEGKYDNYIKKLKNKNNITALNEIETYLLDAVNNTSNSSFVSEHGTIERWVGGVDKEKMTKEISQAAKQARENIKKHIND